MHRFPWIQRNESHPNRNPSAYAKLGQPPRPRHSLERRGLVALAVVRRSGHGPQIQLSPGGRVTNRVKVLPVLHMREPA